VSVQKDLLKWLSSVDLGSHRSQYVTALTEEHTTVEDLLEAAVNGKDKFVSEMKEDYGIKGVIARRMFNSLSALKPPPGTQIE